MIKGILVTIALEIFFPLLAGMVFAIPGKGENSSGSVFLARAYTSGQILLFALFQPLFVYSILKNVSLSKAVSVFLPLSLGISALLLLYSLIRYHDRVIKVIKSPAKKVSIWGIIAAVAVCFMMVMSFFMTYTDGDDAYYVAAASQSASSDAMYVTEPYTGEAILSPYRYLFAPFPMWVAMLSKLSGIRTVAMAHTFFPWSMILLSFAVLYCIADSLFDGEYRKRDIYMLFSSILVMFGDYSIYSPENFLLARSRQGKAALCSFVLPFLFALLLRMIRESEKNIKPRFENFVLIMLAGCAGALCSTMGGALCVCLVCVFALSMMVTRRKFLMPFFMIVSSCPCLVFILMYLIKR